MIVTVSIVSFNLFQTFKHNLLIVPLV